MTTNNNNIVAVIEALGDTIQALKHDIIFKNLEIESLKEQLEIARAELKKSAAKIDEQNATIMKYVEAESERNCVKGATK